MIFLLITHPSCETHLRINEFVVFHIQRVFFLPPAPPSLWKGHVTMNTVKVTAEWSPADEMFVDDSGNLLCTRAHSTGRIWPWPLLFFFCRPLVPQQQLFLFFFFFFLLALVFVVDIYWLPLCAPQPQYQDDHVVGPPLGKEGEAAREVRGRRYVRGPRHSAALLKHTANSIKRCMCIYIRRHLCSICSTLHDPSLR